MFRFPILLFALRRSKSDASGPFYNPTKLRRGRPSVQNNMPVHSSVCAIQEYSARLCSSAISVSQPHRF
jgi:hypothetical protein